MPATSLSFQSSEDPTEESIYQKNRSKKKKTSSLLLEMKNSKTRDRAVKDRLPGRPNDPTYVMKYSQFASPGSVNPQFSQQSLQRKKKANKIHLKPNNYRDNNLLFLITTSVMLNRKLGMVGSALLPV